MGTRIEIILSAVDNLSGTLAAAKGKVDRFGVDVDNTFKRSIVNGLKNMAMGLAALASFEGLRRLTVDAIAFGNAIEDASKRTGLGYEEVQKLDFIAKQSGTSIEAMTRALKFSAQNAEKVREGNAKLGSEYRALGIAVTDTNGNLRGQTAIFYDTVAALQRIENPTQRTAEAYRLFGKGGAEVLAIVNQGNGSLQEMSRRFDDLGLSLSSDAIQNMDKVGDDVQAMQLAFKVFGAELASLTSGPLADAAIGMAKLIHEWKDLLQLGEGRKARFAAEAIQDTQKEIDKLQKQLSGSDWFTKWIAPLDARGRAAIEDQISRLKDLQALQKESLSGIVSQTGTPSTTITPGLGGGTEKAFKGGAPGEFVISQRMAQLGGMAKTRSEFYQQQLMDTAEALDRLGNADSKITDLQIENQKKLADGMRWISNVQREMRERNEQEERESIERRTVAYFSMAQSFNESTRMILSAAWQAQDQRKTMHQLQEDIDNADTERERKIAEDRYRNAKQEAMIAKKRAIILFGLTMAEGIAMSILAASEAWKSKETGGFWSKLATSISVGVAAIAATVSAGMQIKSQSFATGTDFAPGGVARVHQDETVFLPRGSQVATARESRGMGAATLNVTINGGVTRETYPNVTKELRNLSRKMELANRRKYLRVTGNRLATS